VLNVRTGARSVAFGDSGSGHAGSLELRFMAANADVKPGDLLTTSGVDGVYPPGLPVAKVERVERRADSSFARIYCTPQGGVQEVRHVMVLKPTGDRIPARPQADEAPAPRGAASARKAGARK
jgi:rod shape-determining protein MreC